MKYNKIVWIGLALVVVVVLSAASCQRRVPVSDPVDNTIDNTVDNNGDDSKPDYVPFPGTNPPASGLADPAVIFPQLLRETTAATERIHLLQSDAVLTMVSTKYINSLSNTFGLSTNYYIFTSPSEPNYYYLVNIPRDVPLDPTRPETMKRFIMPVQDFNLFFDLLPVPFDRWKVSYAGALEIAEATKGAEFRAQHKTFEVSAILAIPAGHQLNWYITYKATDVSGALLTMQVNAETGEVIIT